ncbi:SDR family NAD(P)-dependent oxidoreductase [Streptomyces sp. YIM 98790]|uniref:SDR family NAD(P)-dependent oxidoreductase n=1 Tax=Streptomyces sp. YIM 98790 TaxID=2689077 RepID=UPI00140A539E|nr:SDR family oxidoreductase [Streptomyces sp. YIM 98790]
MNGKHADGPATGGTAGTGAVPGAAGGDRPLAGRLALVTGASSGIGASAAVALAAAGAGVALAGRRAGLLAEVRERVREQGVPGHAVPVDLSAPDAVPALVDAVRREAGRDPDILVNNAAAARSGPLHRQAPRHWDLVLHLNLTVPFLLSRALLPGMREHGRGCVVNIGSVGGLRALPGAGPYAVAKHALHFMTELLDAENRPAGVRVLCLAPGWVRTGMALDPRRAGVPEDLPLSPEEFAAVLRWAVCLPERVAVGPVIPVGPASERASLEAVWSRLADADRPPWQPQPPSGAPSPEAAPGPRKG